MALNKTILVITMVVDQAVLALRAIGTISPKPMASIFIAIVAAGTTGPSHCRNQEREVSVADAEKLLTRLLNAMDDFMEARQELRQMKSEYTGYSPSYHLSSWYMAEENTKRELGEALNEYIDFRIAAGGKRG